MEWSVFNLPFEFFPFKSFTVHSHRQFVCHQLCSTSRYIECDYFYKLLFAHGIKLWSESRTSQSISTLFLLESTQHVLWFGELSINIFGVYFHFRQSVLAHWSSLCTYTCTESQNIPCFYIFFPSCYQEGVNMIFVKTEPLIKGINC